MSTGPLAPYKYGESRRSERVLLSIPVTIHGEDLTGVPINESTRTIVINAHGALVRMQSFVVLNQILTIQHAQTREELYCRVARFHRDEQGNVEVGLDFMHPSPRFWRISFPPADWTASIEAVAAAVTVQFSHA